MPLHDYRCPHGHHFSHYCKIADLGSVVCCPVHMTPAERVFLTVPFGRVDIPAYQSPVDGRYVGSRRQRREDLARTGCVEWDPGMRQDSERRAAEQEARFEQGLDRTLDQAIHELPAVKRDRLAAEMEAGLDVSLTRN
jgi:hypothetical protein